MKEKVVFKTRFVHMVYGFILRKPAESTEHMVIQYAIAKESAFHLTQSHYMRRNVIMSHGSQLWSTCHRCYNTALLLECLSWRTTWDGFMAQSAHCVQIEFTTKLHKHVMFTSLCSFFLFEDEVDDTYSLGMNVFLINMLLLTLMEIKYIISPNFMVFLILEPLLTTLTKNVAWI